LKDCSIDGDTGIHLFMTDKIKRGNEGECLAADFLKLKGFEIVARNYRHKHCEIDLIVSVNGLIVFVEVKTRTSSAFGEPEDFVDRKKAAKIFEGAEQYIFENNWNGNIRFDIVSVKVGGQPEITHFEDAFY
jgi:putative endonuclease